jgi:hypothetical protein
VGRDAAIGYDSPVHAKKHHGRQKVLPTGCLSRPSSLIRQAARRYGWDVERAWPTSERLRELDMDVYQPMIEGATRDREEAVAYLKGAGE